MALARPPSFTFDFSLFAAAVGNLLGQADKFSGNLRVGLAQQVFFAGEKDVILAFYPAQFVQLFFQVGLVCTECINHLFGLLIF